MRALVTLFAFFAAFCSNSSLAKSEPVIDCPLRDASFSADSPMLDILLSPAARAVVERELNVSFDDAPPRFFGTTSPTFAAILTLHQGGSLLQADPKAIARADSALRAVSVTDADRVARCARYDNEPLDVVLPEGKPRVLLFEKITGFRDGPSVDAAHEMFLRIAEDNDWVLVTTESGGAMTAETLAQFDAVIWNNISGDVLTVAQRTAFRSYIEQGGGFVGVHGSAGDPVYFWDWYSDELIGAEFIGHPAEPQYQDALIVANVEGHPVADNLPREWIMNDEWYSFAKSPRVNGADVVATLDETTYSPVGRGGQDIRMGDHPIAWTRDVGQGRMFYTAIGHRPEVYLNANFVAMVESGVEWAARAKREGAGPIQK